MFVAGAVGLEMVHAQLVFGAGQEQIAALAAHGEEFGEMLGVILLIEAMQRYLTGTLAWDGVLIFSIASRPSSLEAAVETARAP